MTVNKISDIKTTAEYHKLENQFFNEISSLTHEQWLDVCLRFDNDEDNISDAITKIFRIERKIIRDKEWKHRLKFWGGVDEKQKRFFLNLPETVEHNGQPYHLGATAYHASDYAFRSFILMYDNIPAKNKYSALIPCLKPFHGYVTLPPLDFTKKPLELNQKTGPHSIKFADEAFASDFAFHIAFPNNYFTYQQTPYEWDPFPRVGFNKKNTTHATWNFDRFVDLECSFGGESDDTCNICGGELNHLITLPAIEGMPYTTLAQLSLSTCMKCVGWIGEPIFFKHDVKGKPRSLSLDREFENDCGDGGVVKPATVYLSKTSPKFYKQIWGKSDDHNLHRIGGKPSWVQGKKNYKCPDCNRPLTFLMQLDSDLPTVNGQRWLWGSGGVLFIFWCDNCKIDGQMWQCS